MSGVDQLPLDASADWLNANQGVLALTLFVLSAAFAYFTGIIAALRRRPVLRLSVMPGPTLFSVHSTGESHEGHDIHRVSISVYLKIANAGSAPTSIGEIHIGYHWSTVPLTKLWWKHLWKVQWVTNQTVALRDFQVALGSGGDIKVFPFLTQTSALSGRSSKTYLEVGEMTNGVVYFEQSDAFGACQPHTVKGRAAMHLRIFDAFGGVHHARVLVPKLEIGEARKFNPSFGQSLESLRQVPDDDSDEAGLPG